MDSIIEHMIQEKTLLEDRVGQLEEIIRTLHSQSKDSVLTDKWVGWLSIEKSVDLYK